MYNSRIYGFVIAALRHAARRYATVVDRVTHSDFSVAALFWVGAAVVSFLLPLLNRRQGTTRYY